MLSRFTFTILAFVQDSVTGLALRLPTPALAPGKAAISSAHELATEAGFEVLDAGGNAFDAAVAVSAALAVVEPSSSGLGGGGFWLLHRESDGFSTMVDGREEAPGAATRDMYLDDDGEVDRSLATDGPLAAGIPGAAAAWVHMSETYGKLELAEVLQPAIRLAEKGFPVDVKYQQLLNWRAHVMMQWPYTAGIFMPGDELPEIGDVIVQEDLAGTLRRLAEDGHEGFYTGETAGRLVKGSREAGGIWTLEDFAKYQAVEREPVTIEHGDYTLLTAAPPSSGGVAIAQVLNLIEPFGWQEMSRVDRVHLLAEAMRRAYRDRALYLGDPDFVDIPFDMLLSDDYAAGLRTTIRMDRALPSAHTWPPTPTGSGNRTTRRTSR